MSSDFPLILKNIVDIVPNHGCVEDLRTRCEKVKENYGGFLDKDTIVILNRKEQNLIEVWDALIRIMMSLKKIRNRADEIKLGNKKLKIEILEMTKENNEKQKEIDSYAARVKEMSLAVNEAVNALKCAEKKRDSSTKNRLINAETRLNNCK